jgi:alcohol dehydrogenase class IV
LDARRTTLTIPANLSTFSVPTRIVVGEGASAEAGRELAALGAHRVLVVTDGGIVRAGIVQPVCSCLEAAGLVHAAFTEVEANPSVETVERALAAYRSHDCDAILAVGGGSPMDTAKAVGILAANGGAIRNYEGLGKVPNPLPPFVAVPTTVGTGSEVTYFDVITDVQRRFKMAIASPFLAPRVALLDPLLVANLPPALVASTAMDALTHAMESYTSKLSQPFTEAMDLYAVETIAANLRPAVAGDRQARGALLYASAMAGIGFTHSRLGACHAMAHPLGGVCGVPHGVANAILLPHVLEFNLSFAEMQLARLAQAMGVRTDGLSCQEAATAAVIAVRHLAADVGIPASLRAVGVSEESIPQMAADAMTSGNIAINPRPTSLEDITRLYQQAM